MLLIVIGYTPYIVGLASTDLVVCHRGRDLSIYLSIYQIEVRTSEILDYKGS